MFSLTVQCSMCPSILLNSQSPLSHVQAQNQSPQRNFQPRLAKSAPLDETSHQRHQRLRGSERKRHIFPNSPKISQTNAQRRKLAADNRKDVQRGWVNLTHTSDHELTFMQVSQSDEGTKLKEDRMWAQIQFIFTEHLPFSHDILMCWYKHTYFMWTIYHSQTAECNNKISLIAASTLTIVKWHHWKGRLLCILKEHWALSLKCDAGDLHRCMTLLLSRRFSCLTSQTCCCIILVKTSVSGVSFNRLCHQEWRGKWGYRFHTGRPDVAFDQMTLWRQLANFQMTSPYCSANVQYVGYEGPMSARCVYAIGVFYPQSRDREKQHC